MKIDLKDFIEYAMERNLSKPMPCILCGELAKFLGAYIPSKEIQREFKDLADGKVRKLLYGLCSNHEPTEQIVLLAEERVLESYKYGSTKDVSDEIREHKRRQN